MARTSPMAAVVAVVVFLAGAMNIVSAWIGIAPSRLTLLREYLPLEVNHGSRTLVVLAGLLLMLLSWSLFRRKRQAWLAAVILLAVSLALHLFKGLDYEEAVISGVVFGILVGARQEFIVRSDPRSLFSAITMSLLMLAGSVLYSVLGFYLLRSHFTPAFTVPRALSAAAGVVVQADKPLALAPVLHQTTTHHRFLWRFTHPRPAAPQPDRDALWFCDSLVAIAYLSAFFIAAVLLRPVAAALHAGADEREEAKRLLEAAGGPPLAYWALLPGLHYLFSEDRRAVIPYRVADDVAIVLGDPLGHPEAIPALIAAFDQLCLTNDWRPAWYQVTGRWLPELRRRGWGGMKIGEDALIDLPTLSFTGKAWQDVRTALNRLPREGYSALWYDLINDPAEFGPALDAVSREWLAGQHGSEKSFSLGTWDTARRFAREQRLLVLQAADGQPVAFMSFVPIYGENGGWSLDLIRRKKEVPPGSMEFLLATALQAFREEGATVVSLGLSPLAAVTPEDDAGTPEMLDRVRGLIYEHFTRLYNFQGLLRFKAKFQPRWEARYMVYPSLATLPKVLIALMRAHTPPRKGKQFEDSSPEAVPAAIIEEPASS